MTERRVTTTAADIRTGMTLGELQAAVRDAVDSGMAPDSTVKPAVTFRGRLRAVTIVGGHPLG